ncbi:MAG: Ldh family oxidoreductase [Gammaproteobacteria bacterium]|nr:Ldh family oxidoreductase [Gammaproteobacteria bacterium]MDH3466445.1 Ldh family oxidoreductase [Gammaproteobacteria bacterium]
MNEKVSKLELDGGREVIDVDEMTDFVSDLLKTIGCHDDIAQIVAEHLVEANLSGVESHGVMRVMQYVDQFERRYMRAEGRPELGQNKHSAWFVDGCRGIGIPAMIMAMEHGCAAAKEHGVSATAVVNCGHTGRLGAYSELGATQKCLSIIVGGGNRKDWPMVAPYGGKKGLLPTNPYAFGIPGGARGPVILDFATSKIAGGWIYAAKSAGALLPDGTVIDSEGNPTRQPDGYFNGGAILPSGGPKGYGLALMAELIGEAMLGPVTGEINWMVLCVDMERYNDAHTFQRIAEEILIDIRACPPAPGFEKVQVPGERERDNRRATTALGVALPERTWCQMQALAERLRKGGKGMEENTEL